MLKFDTFCLQIRISSYMLINDKPIMGRNFWRDLIKDRLLKITIDFNSRTSSAICIFLMGLKEMFFLTQGCIFSQKFFFIKPFLKDLSFFINIHPCLDRLRSLWFKNKTEELWYFQIIWYISPWLKYIIFSNIAKYILGGPWYLRLK